MRISWIALLCLLSSTAQARPYTVDDMLRLEQYGQVKISPEGNLAIVERRDRYDSAGNYGYSFFVRRLLSKLYAVDLHRPGPLVPLFKQRTGAGYWMGGFSPSGKRLTVFRLEDDRLLAGIVDLPTRRVSWLPFTPDLPLANPVPIWLDENRLIYATLRSGDLPLVLGFGSASNKRSARLWNRMWPGKEPSETIFGSGRFADAGIDDADRAVILFDIRTGKSRTLFNGDISDLALSADRSQLAVVYRSAPIPQSPARPIDPAAAWRRHHLALVDVSTGTAWLPCPRCDVMPNLLAWSPTTTQLLAYARRDGADWEAGSIYRIDARRRRMEGLMPPTLRPHINRTDGSTFVIHATWVGSHPIILASQGSGSQPQWYRIADPKSPQTLTGGLPDPSAKPVAVSDGSFFVVSAGKLWEVRLDGRLRELPLQGVSGVGVATDDLFSLGIRDALNSPLSSLPVVTTKSGDTSSIHLFDRRSRRDRRCALPSRSVNLLAVDATGGISLAYDRAEDGVGRLLRLSCEGGEQTIDRINTHLAGVEPIKGVPIYSFAATGEKLTHWLYLPAPAGSRPPPLVVVPYPGMVFSDFAAPGPDVTSIQTAANPQLLATRGYAVLRPSIPLAWRTGNPIAGLSETVMGAVDAAAATGKIDASRLAVYGHSYGGYAALALAAMSDRLDAVIGSAGIYDLVSSYGDQFEIPEDDLRTTLWPGPAAGFYEGGQGRMGSPPWRDLDRYVRNSPYYSVERIKAPVLLIHGDVDAVPVKQAERMFFALYRTGRDALLLRYAGEGHGFTSPANIRDSWDRIFAFLDRELNGDTEDNKSAR